MNQRPFILRRPFASLWLLVLLILIILCWNYRAHLMAFPGIVSSYTAKEYCSCRYVMNHPEAYCRNYVRLPMPIDEIIDDHEHKQVLATGFWNTQRAVWISPREGCRLTP